MNTCPIVTGNLILMSGNIKTDLATRFRDNDSKMYFEISPCFHAFKKLVNKTGNDPPVW